MAIMISARGVTRSAALKIQSATRESGVRCTAIIARSARSLTSLWVMVRMAMAAARPSNPFTVSKTAMLRSPAWCLGSEAQNFCATCDSLLLYTSAFYWDQNHPPELNRVDDDVSGD